MEIEIKDSRSLKEIQEEFNHKYPFLKIEFYSKPHKEHEGTSGEYVMSGDITIGEARKSHETGDLKIHGNMNVGTLEKDFHDIYGLNVQVFRKSGDVWLQTTSTDDWSLSEQNNEGLEMSR